LCSSVVVYAGISDRSYSTITAPIAPSHAKPLRSCAVDMKCNRVLGNDGRVLWPVCGKGGPWRSAHHHVPLLVGCIQLWLIALNRCPRPEHASPVTGDLHQSVKHLAGSSSITYGCRRQVASGKSLIAVPCDFFRLVVMSTVVFHCSF
jgi:hypothetical protein